MATTGSTVVFYCCEDAGVHSGIIIGIIRYYPTFKGNQQIASYYHFDDEVTEKGWVLDSH